MSTISQTPAKPSQPITLRYAHAVQNPWDNSTPKPFELRNVEGDLCVYRIPFGEICEGEYLAEIEINGEIFRETDPDKDEAVKLAIHEAAYRLMDTSRKPWERPAR